MHTKVMIPRAQDEICSMDALYFLFLVEQKASAVIISANILHINQPETLSSCVNIKHRSPVHRYT